jgi:ankyrin repeat protein
MHVACKEGHLECVQLLLEQGGSLNQRNKVGNTPLHMAARHGRLAVATTLLKSAKGRLAKGCHSALGSITNTKGRTPLHLAAAKGDVDLLALLLSYRPRLEAVDVEGKTALYCAVERRHTSCLHLLLKAGAGVGDGAKETKGRKEASHHYYYG